MRTRSSPRYSGDAAYLTSTSPTLTQTVLGSALRATTTVVTSNRNPSANIGQNITFTATVRPVTGTGIPAGTVQFNIDGANVGGALTLNAQGRATYSITAATLGAGSHNIIATYNGSAIFAGSGSATFVQVVNQAASTTTVTSNRNPASVFGQSVTFTARVQPVAATGTVQFSVDGSPVGGPVALDTTGRATLVTSTLAVGSHTISAAYSGNTNYTASIGAITRPVNKANSRTVVTTSGSPAPFGSTVVFTATVSAVAPGVGTPTGTVQFRIDGVNVGAPVALNPSGQATYATSTLTVGTPYRTRRSTAVTPTSTPAPVANRNAKDQVGAGGLPDLDWLGLCPSQRGEARPSQRPGFAVSCARRAQQAGMAATSGTGRGPRDDRSGRRLTVLHELIGSAGNRTRGCAISGRRYHQAARPDQLPEKQPPQRSSRTSADSLVRRRSKLRARRPASQVGGEHGSARDCEGLEAVRVAQGRAGALTSAVSALGAREISRKLTIQMASMTTSVATQ